MLIVHVHVRVLPGRTADFLAATLVNARASARFSAVFPTGSGDWATGAGPG